MQEQYFEWLCSIVGPGDSEHNTLLRYLYDVDYVWSIPMDQNRAQDGIDLRFIFANLFGIDHRVLMDIFLEKQCSMLEMMVAFANRIENDFMANEKTNGVSNWFWSMIFSLGFQFETDQNFSKERVDLVLTNFFNHAYQLDGSGSLFYIPGTRYDLRQMQLWDQMNHWLIWYNNM